MIMFAISSVFLGLLVVSPVYAQQPDVLYPEWQVIFDEYAANGTLVILDKRQSLPQRMVFNPERARQRMQPASTFKIPHALFALDAGVVEDEFQIFPWDGVERDFAVHNQDQDLRSSMRNSAVWVYELFGAQLGEEKARQYLTRIGYGNVDPGGDTSTYWIDGNLQISAHEQIDFLEQLYWNQLPFKEADQRLVKDIMIVEAGRDWILRAKTGWQGTFGWWVGWVEWPSGPVFFALNIDTPDKLDDLYKREAITRSILQKIRALPGSASSASE